jgi:NAD(P)-dependent dehydrogenase (short-subunit alcohol dehydrogenase family)
MELKDKIAVVTGASSGLGRAVATRFLQEGAIVAGVARNQTALNSMQADRFLAFPADLSDEAQTVEGANRILEKLGGVDILVHAAGIIGSGTIETTSLQTWDTMMNINLRSIFHLTQLLLPSLIERKGNIVNISSVAGLRSFPGVLTYCVSKAALDQLTRCSALELAAKGVRVNAINPGVVVTPLHRSGGMDEERYQTFLEHSKTTHPMGRVGTPDEVADLVLFLSSERASWITGVTYSIDGGRSLTCAR